MANPRNQESQKRVEIIAECIADTGYGTDYYDRETNECHLGAYAGVLQVISNPEYWKQYDEYMSVALFNDFGLPWGFKKYRLVVYSDDTKKFFKTDETNTVTKH